MTSVSPVEYALSFRATENSTSGTPTEGRTGPHRKGTVMTVRHIDATDETSGVRIVKIVWNEANDERELTVRMPSDEKTTASNVDVELLQIPGETPETTLDHAVSALEENILGSDAYVHIDGNDIKNICTGALTAAICVEGESTDAIEDAFDERLSASGIKADAVTGAAIAIEGPEGFRLAEIMTVIHGIQNHLPDEATIVWALKLTDTDIPHVTTLLAIPREQ